MVKKLLKHEFIYYFRSYGIFLPIVLVISLITRLIIAMAEEDNVIHEIAVASSSIMLAVSCFALVLLSFVVCVVRFYKNMYSAEGYLTFTLPVTNFQHIFVKLFCALVCQLVSVLVAGVAAVIALSGEPLREIVWTFAYMFRGIINEVSALNTVAYVIEMLIFALAWASYTMLLYYGCITVGQTAKKNRILKAVGAYFVYYIATQIVGTVFSMIFIPLGLSGVLERVLEWAELHSSALVHIYLCGGALIYAALAAAFWAVTQTIMTKKLNLE